MQRRTAEWIRQSLTDTFGPPTLLPQDPVEVLVTTILSQNTNDANRDRAYACLLERFGSLEAVSRASAPQIASAIQAAGLETQKARTIVDVLRRIREAAGRLDLSFLGDLSAGEAFAWLRASRGIGAKTASIVLLFSFGMPFFPVDTHIRRVLRRMGVIAETGDAFRQAQDALPKDAPLLRDLHLLVIQLGRTLCRPSRPACTSCPLVVRCEFGRTAPVTP